MQPETDVMRTDSCSHGLALLGRPQEGKGHLDDFGALLVRGQGDRWREAQWLAPRALFLVEVPGDPAELETIIREFHALAIPARKVPLQIRHV